MLREVAISAQLIVYRRMMPERDVSRSLNTDLNAVFAARGWLSEHPAAFRARLIRNGVAIELRAGTCVFRRDDESDGLYGIVSGSIGVEGGHRHQSPLLGHVFRRGEWFGIKAVLHGGPRSRSRGRELPAAVADLENRAPVHEAEARRRFLIPNIDPASAVAS
jgi:hypothetical protein